MHVLRILLFIFALFHLFFHSRTRFISCVS
jgi:hypothetical protein